MALLGLAPCWSLCPWRGDIGQAVPMGQMGTGYSCAWGGDGPHWDGIDCAHGVEWAQGRLCPWAAVDRRAVPWITQDCAHWAGLGSVEKAVPESRADGAKGKGTSLPWTMQVCAHGAALGSVEKAVPRIV